MPTIQYTAARSPRCSEPLGPGEFVALAYRLGRSRATGVLTIYPVAGDAEVLVLSRGYLMAAEVDALGRRATQTLSRIAALQGLRSQFDGGATAHHSHANRRQFPLALWARRHLESQVDGPRAHHLVKELAGVRLSLRAELVPTNELCDETDQRILAAMAKPLRIDQIWPLARTPRFRLIGFLHFLRSVGALRLSGVAVPAAVHASTSAAHRLLGVSASADRTALKRAYRRLARTFHPDLHPAATDAHRRDLERKLAAVTDAYRELSSV